MKLPQTSLIAAAVAVCVVAVSAGSCQVRSERIRANAIVEMVRGGINPAAARCAIVSAYDEAARLLCHDASIFAQGIVARSGETALAGSTEGKSPTPQRGDAP